MEMEITKQLQKWAPSMQSVWRSEAIVYGDNQYYSNMHAGDSWRNYSSMQDKDMKQIQQYYLIMKQLQSIYGDDEQQYEAISAEAII